jgi:hypothetical protein
VRSITLHFIGGVTAIDGEAASPRQELVISAVGPVTSLGIGGSALLLFRVMPEGLLSFVVGGLAAANLLVGVLNLVPGLPLDGGRVLRAGIWKLTGDPHRSMVAAGWAGRVVAVVALASPLWLQAVGAGVTPFDYLIAVVFGWFLWTAATSAIATAKVRARLPSLQARQLARRTLPAPEDLPVAEAIRRAQEVEAGSIVTLDAAGLPTGVVNEAAVQATPEDRRPWLPLSSVSRSLESGLTLPADIGGEQLIRAMQRTPATEYVLVEPDGSIFGVLCTVDVDRAFDAGR